MTDVSNSLIYELLEEIHRQVDAIYSKLDELKFAVRALRGETNVVPHVNDAPSL
jgi:hypothetical protein